MTRRSRVWHNAPQAQQNDSYSHAAFITNQRNTSSNHKNSNANDILATANRQQQWQHQHTSKITDEMPGQWENDLGCRLDVGPVDLPAAAKIGFGGRGIAGFSKEQWVQPTTDKPATVLRVITITANDWQEFLAVDWKESRSETQLFAAITSWRFPLKLLKRPLARYGLRSSLGFAQTIETV